MDELSYQDLGELPKIEELIPLGSSEKYKIISLDKNIMELEDIMPNGQVMIIKYTKQDTHFSRG